MTIRTAGLAMLAAAAVGAGCGSGGENQAVRDAVNGWAKAVARHDDGAACARLSDGLRRRIERHLLGEGVEGSCATWAAKYVSPRNPASHRSARITALRISGPHAAVTLTATGVEPGSATLVKEHGGWRIDNY